MEPDELASIAHEPAAFEAFYRAHVEAVQRFVVRRVADPHLAADLTAEVFLAAIDAAPAYKPGRGTPAAWLFGIARHVVCDERRRAARERRALIYSCAHLHPTHRLSGGDLTPRAFLGVGRSRDFLTRALLLCLTSKKSHP